MRGGARVRVAVLAATAIALCAPAAAPAQVPVAPGISPPGANDWGCRPTAAHPSPVILVHGTFADMTVSWNSLSPLLKRDGFCVFALDYGLRGTAPMEQSADELAAFAQRVLTATGAARVSFVGHSQGGPLARLAVRFRGLLPRTDDVIGLAPSSHGTTNPFAPPAGTFGCGACADQVAGSPLMQRLNAPPEAPAPVSWTVVSTRYDEVVTPYQSQALSGSTVTNVVLQDKCPVDPVEHVGMPGDPVALQWVRDALLRTGPANPAFRPDCTGLTTGTDPDAPAAGNGRTLGVRPTLSVVSRTVHTHHGFAHGRVRCDGPRGTTCIRRLGLRVGRRTLAARTVRVRAGRRAAVNLRLRRGAQPLLRRHPKMVATLGGTPVILRRG